MSLPNEAIQHNEADGDGDKTDDNMDEGKRACRGSQCASLNELEKIVVDDLMVRRTHAMRQPGIDFERGSFDQFARQHG